ncbi:hypothetical protein FN846DRAFT_910225 [Sphaerosporella brunnea]|uniref:Uncharacterized protein n=1 Tax=Sphaerosporella brunnea TaxID=1250544 RepID=A0A5J5EQ03_9PEZI|nr:hypothetical protein FN846DRAFT_910225 [Sphaerosporella brunnea]
MSALNMRPPMGNCAYKDLFEHLCIDTSEHPKLSIVLEHDFLEHEKSLSNHTKWSKVLVERLVASKTITTDEWFKNAESFELAR